MKYNYFSKSIAIIISIALILILNHRSFAGVGDTTVVQTLRFDSTMRAGVFQFPDDSTKTYEKIIMLYSMRCHDGLISTQTNPNMGCGEWDYNCYTYIVDSSQTDSLKSSQNSYLISNYIDTVFRYTNNPIWSYFRYNQQQVTYTGITSEDSAVIGNGTTALNDPFNTSNKIGRTQYLWTAAELTSAGLTAGNITGLRMDFLSTGNSLDNLRIRIKNTSKTALSPDSAETSGFTEVYFLNTAVTLNGKHSFNFSAPFNWNGTSNIIIDFSFSNASTGTLNTVNGQSAGFNAGLISNQNDSYINANGSLSCINVNPGFFPSITDKITVAFWAYGDSIKLPANTSIIYGVDNNNNKQLNVHLPWSDSNIYWDCGNDGAGYDRVNALATNNQIKGQWNFWAFTKNATTGIMNIYLNGILWAWDVGKFKMIDIKKMITGMATTGTNGYYGSYDEISIWNKDLSAASIKQIMFNDISNSHPDYANLLAYYKLNEGTSDTAHDSSPNGFNSSIMNPSWRSHNGKTLFRNFASTQLRPNTSFVKGVYTQTVQYYPVLDSAITNTTSVISYSVTNNNLNVIDTMYVWPSGYAYIYDSVGVKVDSILVSADDTLHVSTLPYYQKRPMRMELINFITPYGKGLDLNGLIGKTWEFDVTDYAPLLKGSRYLAMEDGKNQEDNDIKFVFYEGTPPRNVKSVSQVWPSGSWVSPSYNDIYTNKYFEPRTFDLTPGAKQFKIKSAISGHGQQGEFIARSHTIRLNNTLNFTRSVWKTCASNPIYPQGGTWVYDRAGWCPGAAVDCKEYEITSNVTPDSAITLDYSLPALASPGASNYRVNNQLVSYGDANFILDAAVDYIKTPSKRTEFTRFNPICNEPVIKIKNTGSTQLTSLDITYGRESGVMSTYHWTGSLNFLDTVMVTLPAPDWTSSNINNFIAVVGSPNGGVDEYAGNDTMYSSFDSSAVYPPGLVFVLKTNSLGSQTRYTLKNSQGTAIISKLGLGNNIIYRDTVALNDDCYTLYLTDAGNDGLEWWANPNQGAGYFRIVNAITGVVLKDFDPDFGSNIYEQFTVNFSIPVIEPVVNSIDNLLIYPNPAGDLFTAEFSLPISSKATIKLLNVLGDVLISQTFLVTQTLEKARIDVSSIEAGIYFVVVEAGDKKAIKKLVLY